MVSESRWIIFLLIQCYLAVQELKNQMLLPLIGPMAHQNQSKWWKHYNKKKNNLSCFTINTICWGGEDWPCCAFSRRFQWAVRNKTKLNQFAYVCWKHWSYAVIILELNRKKSYTLFLTEMMTSSFPLILLFLHSQYKNFVNVFHSIYRFPNSISAYKLNNNMLI